jgi:hypothetical protein
MNNENSKEKSALQMNRKVVRFSLMMHLKLK